MQVKVKVANFEGVVTPFPHSHLPFNSIWLSNNSYIFSLENRILEVCANYDFAAQIWYTVSDTDKPQKGTRYWIKEREGIVSSEIEDGYLNLYIGQKNISAEIRRRAQGKHLVVELRVAERIRKDYNR